MKSLDNKYACNFSVMNQHTICNTFPTIKSDSSIEKLRSKYIFLSDVGGESKVIDGLVSSTLLPPKKEWEHRTVLRMLRAQVLAGGPAPRAPSPLCAGWRGESDTLRDLGSLRWRFKEDGHEQPELR